MSDDQPVTDVEPDPAGAEPSAVDGAEGGPVLQDAEGRPYCANCKKHVDPLGRGLCPSCGRFLPDHTVSVTTGLRSKKLAKVVDAYRVGLIEQLFNERGGKDALSVVERISIENYALNCAQAKTIEARLDQDGLFTQTGRRRSAFDMLKGISETIDRLRAQLPPMTALNKVTEQVTVIRRVIVDARVDPVRPAADYDQDEYIKRVTHDPAASPTTPSLASSTSQTPKCPYCRHSIPECLAMQKERRDVWRTIHGSRADVAKEIEDERVAQETEIMLHQIGRRTRGDR